jgi:5-oxopent-3-ene-1,2,5-tricarboxylate decarboxylase/2-hydroxyhepta-2,4-diene-1,7-dioate isomerase
MGGTIGLIIGRTAGSVAEEDALSYLAGLVVANDVSIPYESHYRPAIKQRCRDGFCPVGPLGSAAATLDPDRLEVIIEIDGRIQSRVRGDGLVRGAARLLADVSTFITFEAGDILLLGEPHEPPLASPGQRVRVVVEGIGSLANEVGWE